MQCLSRWPCKAERFRIFECLFHSLGKKASDFHSDFRCGGLAVPPWYCLFVLWFALLSVHKWNQYGPAANVFLFCYIFAFSIKNSIMCADGFSKNHWKRFHFFFDSKQQKKNVKRNRSRVLFSHSSSFFSLELFSDLDFYAWCVSGCVSACVCVCVSKFVFYFCKRKRNIWIAIDLPLPMSNLWALYNFSAILFFFLVFSLRFGTVPNRYSYKVFECTHSLCVRLQIYINANNLCRKFSKDRGFKKNMSQLRTMVTFERPYKVYRLDLQKLSLHHFHLIEQHTCKRWAAELPSLTLVAVFMS